MFVETVFRTDPELLDFDESQGDRREGRPELIEHRGRQTRGLDVICEHGVNWRRQLLGQGLARGQLRLAHDLHLDLWVFHLRHIRLKDENRRIGEGVFHDVRQGIILGLEYVDRAEQVNRGAVGFTFGLPHRVQGRVWRRLGMERGDGREHEQQAARETRAPDEFHGDNRNEWAGVCKRAHIAPPSTSECSGERACGMDPARCYMEYEAVIGLETHVQLKTKSKMWCGCANEFGAPPNTNVCPVCLGMPGVLPVANEEALKLTVLTGLLLNCTIPPYAKFDRKNYFYPDVAKNYQVTQYDKPSTANGYLDFEFEGGLQRVRITRAHLEEDVGKNFHFDRSSGVDFNRAGVPLLEIVSEPDLRSADMAYDYLNALKELLVYGKVSD